MKEAPEHLDFAKDQPSRIERQPAAAAGQPYDVIVIGGGIFGTMVAAEAADRGAAVLLLEKDDFGGATSFNSLKTIHGGLRYLQSFDVLQHHRFVSERRWFLQRFPSLVERLPVLMPLYDRGLRRPLVMRGALLTDHLLSLRRNTDLPEERRIPRGFVIGPARVKRAFPMAPEQGLTGGAVWFDASMPNPQRLIMEVLRHACSRGAAVLNYVSATGLLTSHGRVQGVRARDHVSHREFEFRGHTVINAAGPWSRELGKSFDRDYPELFRYSIAWNVLVDRDAISKYALAVAPARQDGRVYFIHPWKGRMLVGTGHAPREKSWEKPEPTEAELHDFLDDINEAVPELNLSVNNVEHVYSGYLPVRRKGTVDLTSQPVILDHSKAGGPRGLISVAGNKFTASRRTAEQVALRLGPQRNGHLSSFDSPTVSERTSATTFAYDWMPEQIEPGVKEAVTAIIRDEAVVHLDDLVLRRTGIGDNPQRALALAPELANLFDWGPDRRAEEQERLRSHFRWTTRRG